MRKTQTSQYIKCQFVQNINHTYENELKITFCMNKFKRLSLYYGEYILKELKIENMTWDFAKKLTYKGSF